jgi:hypothetical protein
MAHSVLPKHRITGYSLDKYELLFYSVVVPPYLYVPTDDRFPFKEGSYVRSLYLPR